MVSVGMAAGGSVSRGPTIGVSTSSGVKLGGIAGTAGPIGALCAAGAFNAGKLHATAPTTGMTIIAKHTCFFIAGLYFYPEFWPISFTTLT
jgi:hypothetical protein